jgi:hypothetical protein
MNTVVKLLAIVEIEVDADDPVGAAQDILDTFREAVIPSENYGVTIYRATGEDLTRELVSNQAEVLSARREL